MLSTGTAESGSFGILTLGTGDAGAGSSGAVSISARTSSQDGNGGGSVSVTGGASTSSTGMGGSIALSGGEGAAGGGAVDISAGGGALSLQSDEALTGVDALSSLVTLACGESSGRSGDMNIASGVTTSSESIHQSRFGDSANRIVTGRHCWGRGASLSGRIFRFNDALAYFCGP